MTRTLIQKIQLLMANDTEDQSDRLQQLYEDATLAQKGVIDEIFICLCGYSLATILAGDAL